MWTGIVRDLDPIQISLPAVQILARSISSVHVGNIITLVLEEALLGNNDDDSTVKPIQQDISNCKCLCVEREKRERRYAKAFSMWEREREGFQTAYCEDCRERTPSQSPFQTWSV